MQRVSSISVVVEPALAAAGLGPLADLSLNIYSFCAERYQFPDVVGGEEGMRERVCSAKPLESVMECRNRAYPLALVSGSLRGPACKMGKSKKRTGEGEFVWRR